MRWDGCGVDDDPNDARRNGDDDGGVSPLREGNFPADFSLPELFFSLSGCRLVEAEEKFLIDPPDVFRSRVNNTLKRAGEGPQGPGAGPSHGPRWARGRGSPLPPVARLFAPFWFRDLFP